VSRNTTKTMTESKRLDEREARRFLELLEKVEEDMEQAAYGETTDSFDDKSEYESYEEKWGAPRGQISVEEARGKIRKFVEHAYLQDDENPDVRIDDEIEDKVANVAEEAGMAEDREEALEEVRRGIAENIEDAEPMLQSPLEKDEIESIESEELRALAWDLDAVAKAYNYATDPTLPDITREDGDTWITNKEEIRLNEAGSLLKEVYSRIYGRVGEDLEGYSTEE
jgi:hypothetical protein